MAKGLYLFVLILSLLVFIVAADDFQRSLGQCQNGATACVVLVREKGLDPGAQSPTRNGDQIHCVENQYKNQLCQYTKTGWLFVGCRGSIMGIQFQNGNSPKITYDGTAKDFAPRWQSRTFVYITCIS